MPPIQAQQQRAPSHAKLAPRPFTLDNESTQRRACEPWRQQGGAREDEWPYEQPPKGTPVRVRADGELEHLPPNFKPYLHPAACKPLTAGALRLFKGVERTLKRAVTSGQLQRTTYALWHPIACAHALYDCMRGTVASRWTVPIGSFEPMSLHVYGTTYGWQLEEAAPLWTALGEAIAPSGVWHGIGAAAGIEVVVVRRGMDGAYSELGVWCWEPKEGDDGSRARGTWWRPKSYLGSAFDELPFLIQGPCATVEAQ